MLIHGDADFVVRLTAATEFMSNSFQAPISSIKTADGFPLADLGPREGLYLVLPNSHEPAEVIFSITRSGDIFYIALFDPENWYGHDGHRGCGYCDWEIEDLFKSEKKALTIIGERLKLKAQEILERAEALSCGSDNG